MGRKASIDAYSARLAVMMALHSAHPAPISNRTIIEICGGNEYVARTIIDSISVIYEETKGKELWFGLLPCYYDNMVKRSESA